MTEAGTGKSDRVTDALSDMIAMVAPATARPNANTIAISDGDMVTFLRALYECAHGDAPEPATAAVSMAPVPRSGSPPTAPFRSPTATAAPERRPQRRSIVWRQTFHDLTATAFDTGSLVVHVPAPWLSGVLLSTVPGMPVPPGFEDVDFADDALNARFVVRRVARTVLPRFRSDTEWARLLSAFVERTRRQVRHACLGWGGLHLELFQGRATEAEVAPAALELALMLRDRLPQVQLPAKVSGRRDSAIRETAFGPFVRSFVATYIAARHGQVDLGLVDELYAAIREWAAQSEEWGRVFLDSLEPGGGYSERAARVVDEALLSTRDGGLLVDTSSIDHFVQALGRPAVQQEGTVELVVDEDAAPTLIIPEIELPPQTARDRARLLQPVWRHSHRGVEIVAFRMDRAVIRADLTLPDVWLSSVPLAEAPAGFEPLGEKWPENVQDTLVTRLRRTATRVQPRAVAAVAQAVAGLQEADPKMESVTLGPHGMILQLAVPETSDELAQDLERTEWLLPWIAELIELALDLN